MNYIYENSYGIRWNMNPETPQELIIERIGNFELHKTLPIQSSMKLIDIDGNLFVRVKLFYKKIEFKGDIVEMLISEQPLHGFIPDYWFSLNGRILAEQYIGAYEGSIVDERLSSVSKAIPTTSLTIDQFRNYARNNGSEYYIESFFARSAIQLLYLIEYASWDIHKSIGAGATDWSFSSWLKFDFNPVNKTGLSDKLNGLSGSECLGDGIKGSFMSYRGIENIIGHIWKYMDGINISDNKVFVCNDPINFQSDTKEKYIDTGIILPEQNGWQIKIANTDIGFLPNEISMNNLKNSMYSYYWRSYRAGWRVVLSGGGLYYGAYAGVACFYAFYASSLAATAIGSRLCKIGKFI